MGNAAHARRGLACSGSENTHARRDSRSLAEAAAEDHVSGSNWGAREWRSGATHSRVQRIKLQVERHLATCGDRLVAYGMQEVRGSNPVAQLPSSMGLIRTSLASQPQLCSPSVSADSASRSATKPQVRGTAGDWCHAHEHRLRGWVELFNGVRYSCSSGVIIERHQAAITGSDTGSLAMSSRAPSREKVREPVRRAAGVARRLIARGL